jgi:RNA polymerase sigma factor (sigma-70 family)
MVSTHSKILEFWTVILSEIELYVKKNVPLDDVEDVLQEILLVIIRKFNEKMRRKNGSYKTNNDFKLWTYRIATNKIFNKRKRNKRNFHLDISAFIDKIPGDDEVEDAIRKLMIQQALSQLSQSDLMLLQLRENALPFREISQIMKKSETALTSQFYRLKKKLVKSLKLM